MGTLRTIEATQEGEHINNNFKELDTRSRNAWTDCGDWDASDDEFPEDGGTGTDGAILRNNVFNITEAGDLPGDNHVEPGSAIRALVDDPGQDPTKWGYL